MTRRRRLGRALANLAIIGSMFLLRACVVRPATAFPGDHFNRGKNAAWIGVEWVNDPHTSAEITALGDDLRQKQIAYAYAYVSYWHPNGEFGKNHVYAADFVKAFKKAHPDIKLLGWIGIAIVYADLSDPAVRQKITQFCAELIQKYSFDGVQLDPEPVDDKNPYVVQLLDETRLAIGAGKLLSIATPQVWFLFSDQFAERYGSQLWSAAYYRQIASHTDQIAVMSYDSSLGSPWLYRQWIRFQVIQISKAISESGTGVELLFGVPTSEEVSFTHKPNAENMPSGLQGVIDGLNDDEAAPDAVTGVAIYPYWETDSAEWSVYSRLWLGK